MLRLFSTFEPTRIPWLPQFLAHYRALGVECFHLTLQVEPDLPPDLLDLLLERVRRVFAGFDVPTLHVLSVPFTAMAVRDHLNHLQRTLTSPSDWLVWADLDEFQDYGATLPEVISRAERLGCQIIQGTFLDRIAKDGTLATFLPDKPISQQYPLGCHLTRDVLLGDVVKTVCARSTVRLRPANHRPERGQRLSRTDDNVTVHHYKWDSSVLHRLAYRLRPEWKQACPWWVQTQRFFDFIGSSGRIDLVRLETIQVEPLSPPPPSDHDTARAVAHRPPTTAPSSRI